ncbi:hypothetical protein [Pseudonocardia sp. H11422]|uniref:hypothetical protein n=1 Tax=Pseudonocardia sp. H11422 TaxID=2835866 RepID=UPI001BDBB638|nr:hypothetical protein [Pseudonocardia sp. H11422]
MTEPAGPVMARIARAPPPRRSPTSGFSATTPACRSRPSIVTAPQPGRGHRQLGDAEQAREHVRSARERLHELGSGDADGYAATIRTALDRVERELGG